MKQRAFHWIIRNALSAAAPPALSVPETWQSDSCYLSKWVLKRHSCCYSANCKCLLKNQAHFSRAKIRAQLLWGQSETASTFFSCPSWKWSGLFRCSLTLANMGLSDNPANLNLEKSGRKQHWDEGSVASLLFYYLVSLWRNPQIASTDPGFTVAYHPGNL